MGVEELIESSFRKLLVSLPYQKITVSLICEDTGIARRTFYSHFDNKEAILSAIFDRDIIRTQTSMRDILPDQVRKDNALLFMSKLYEAILEDGDFYYKLVGPLKGKDDTFLRVATNSIYRLACQVFDGSSQHTSEQERDYAAYFFASSQAMLMQKWISEKMVVPPEVLASWYQKFTIAYWADRLE